MDDLPEKDTPRAWIAFGILLAAVTLAFFMLVYTHVRAEAQEQQHCGPAEILLRQFSEIHKERPVWEGTVHSETGPVEVILLQGDKNTWTLFSIQGSIQGAVACVIATGKDATPIADKGV
jgi:hypothetical protein